MCDAKAIGHGATGSRTTARAHTDAKVLAGSTDVVLYYKEVAGETHGLHDVQFKLDALLRFSVQVLAVALVCTLIRQLGQIVGFQFDAIQFVESTELFDFRHTVLFAHHHVAVLIAGKLFEEVLLGIFGPIPLLSTEVLGYGKVGHDGGMVYAVSLDFIADFACVGQHLGQVGEDGVHLGLRLKPLLLGVEHAVGVV